MKKRRISIAIKLLFLVVIVELLIMFLLHRFEIVKESPYLMALVDAVALGIIINFGLYFLLSRPFNKIFRAMDKVGEEDFSVRLTLKQNDEIGQLAESFNNMISSLQKAEEEKIQRNQFIETVTQGIEEGLMLLDTNLKILWANKKVIESSGLKRDEVIGNYCYKVTHRRDDPCKAPQDICPISEVIKTGKPVTVLHTHFDKEGNKFYAEVSAYPVRDNKGAIVRFIHVSHNVTERIRMIEELKSAKAKIEEYSQTLEDKVEERTKELKATQAKLLQAGKMAAVGQLASGVAHELNNPLSTILNNAKLIKIIIAQGKDFNLGELKEDAEFIEESVSRCKKITQSLLDFSHVSTGQWQSVSVNEVIEKVLVLVEHDIKFKDIIIQKDLQGDLPRIKGDPQLLQEVFFNIIANASWAIEKKGDEKGGTITIKSQYHKDANSIVILISDTGIGIAKDNLDRLFEAFFTTKDVGEGTGLGLSIAYNIVKSHKGTIEVESQEHKGTTFKITLAVS